MTRALPYWDRVAPTKRFTHPLDLGLLAQHLPRTARILDYGCGYGRLVSELRANGWSSVVGLDASGAMIERARQELPEAQFFLETELESDEQLGVFDAVLLFAVWTCIPEDSDLERLMRRVSGRLAPGGLLLVSDLHLQEDERNRSRYSSCDHPTHGVFELEPGLRLRHFEERRVHELLGGFERVHERKLEVRTMNGNPASAFQVLARRNERAEDL